MIKEHKDGIWITITCDYCGRSETYKTYEQAMLEGIETGPIIEFHQDDQGCDYCPRCWKAGV